MTETNSEIFETTWCERKVEREGRIYKTNGEK